LRRGAGRSRHLAAFDAAWELGEGYSREALWDLTARVDEIMGEAGAFDEEAIRFFERYALKVIRGGDRGAHGRAARGAAAQDEAIIADAFARACKGRRTRGRGFAPWDAAASPRWRCSAR
jgi:hypothetical protein